MKSFCIEICATKGGRCFAGLARVIADVTAFDAIKNSNDAVNIHELSDDWVIYIHGKFVIISLQFKKHFVYS